MNFLPLNTYSGYSFLKSSIKLEDYVKEAKSRNYDYLGLIDLNNMFAFPLFNKLCKKNNLNPIFGLTFQFIEGIDISFIIKNEDGYINLLKLSNLYNKKKISEKPNEENIHLSLKDLTSLNGLILIIKSSSKKFQKIDSKLVAYLKSLSSFIPFSYIGLENDFNHDHLNLIRDFLKEDFKLIAFPIIRHLSKDEDITLSLLSAIEHSLVLNFGEEMHQDYHFLNEDEFNEFYLKDEIKNLNEIKNQINFEFVKKRGEIINFAKEINSSKTSEEYLKELLLLGLKEKNIDLKQDTEYRNRLNYEYLTIVKMGYADYFLIVQDYVNYAKKSNIIVGPGRGSAAGSLVSYLLNITDVDPLKYNLLFERFLNPERNSMPDIDIDFQDNRRDEVFFYLQQKYGYQSASHVIAFQKIKAKQAIQDICRIYNYGTDFAKKLSSSIPDNYKNKDGSPEYTLLDAYNNIDTFKKIVDSSIDFKDIYEKGRLIEGLPRQATLHAAGIILSSNSLLECIPVIYNSENVIVSQFEKDYLEEQGFLKFDLLGLSNLTIIALTLSLLNRSDSLNEQFEKLPIDEPKIYKLLQNDLLMGLFQIDANAGRIAIHDIKPNKFIEIVDAISLARPGPIKYIKNYVLRKNNRQKPKIPTKELEPILASTYGIIIYQEQIMQIARTFAGFSFSEADTFRRAISKKDREQILLMQDKFIKGSIKKGNKKDLSIKVFNAILKFASYGFNKSHAVAYAMITAKMAYLKSIHPIEFYSSILTMQYSSSSTKILKYLAEIKKMGIKVLNPNINSSELIFIPYSNSIVFPLSAIKGVSNNLIKNIIEDRHKKGIYKDLFDFVGRMYNYPEKITETQFALLIDAGAFDSFSKNRKAIKHIMKDVIDHIKVTLEGKFVLEGEILPFIDEKIYQSPIDKINDEIKVLGVSLSDNILNHIKLDERTKSEITLISELKNESFTTILGIIKNVKAITIKNGLSKGKLMAFVTLEDQSDEIDCLFFAENYTLYQASLKTGNLVLLKGKYEIKDDKKSFIVNNLMEVTLDE